MATMSFRVCQRLVMNGVSYRIARDLGKGQLVLEDLVSGRYHEHALADLLRAWKEGELVSGDSPSDSESSVLARAIQTAHRDAFRQSYTEDQQASARAKLVFVERLERLPRTSSVATPIIQEIWSDKRLWGKEARLKNAPHFTTVATWIRRYQAAERDIRVLIDRNMDKGNRDERVDAIVAGWTEDLLETRFLSEERPSLKSIHKDLVGLTAERNTTRLASERLKPPSYAYLKKRVAEMAPYDVCKARYGHRVAELKFRVAGQYLVPDKPMARASMDHSRLDIFVVDEATRLPLGRPWLTLILDDNTRNVIGYYISFEPPSGVSMTRALKHALEPKELDPETKNLWDAWGVMDVLAVDNGLEFHGKTLEAGAGRYGITVLFCPRKKPWFKGKIERFFGTLNTGLLIDIKGKTFSNIFQKGDYDPAKHAVVTLQTLKRVVEMWIVDVYHQDVHRGLGMPPMQAWRERIQGVDRYLPPSSLALDAAFSASTTRALTHKGIEFDSLFYNSAELGVLRNHQGSEITVEVRTYDDELGSLVVVAPDGSTVIRVPAVDVDYATGLSRWQHRVCKKYQRRLLEDDAREIGLLDARRRIRALIEEDMQLNSRSTRTKQKRLTQSSPSVPASAAALLSAAPPISGDDAPLDEARTASSPASDRAVASTQQKSNDLSALDALAIPEFTSRIKPS